METSAVLWSWCVFLTLVGKGLSDFNLEDVIADIRNHQDEAKQIHDFVLTGTYKHKLYDRLAEWVDKSGPRFVGTKALSDSIESLRLSLISEGFSNVHVENFTHPSWRRGNESATLLLPRTMDISILGLFFTLGTPPGGLTADVLVVRDFDELTEKAAQANGKIVVYNIGWSPSGIAGYNKAATYRSLGALEAAKVGAVAALVESATEHSLYTPHTGTMTQATIPGASITREDVDLLQRMQDRGEIIRIHINMEHDILPDDTSFNLVADLTGSTFPDEIVQVSGHLDTVDVGQGAMDDGGGVFLGLQVLRTVKDLGLVPKRTLRFLGPSAEEIGLFGAIAYRARHESEVDKIDLALHQDMGTFQPTAILFRGAGLARFVMEEVMQLLEPIGVTQVIKSNSTSSLTSGFPYANLLNENQNYFDYHHSKADTMSMMDPDVLDLCSVTWTTMAYVVADLEEPLPKSGDYPTPVSGCPLRLAISGVCGFLVIFVMKYTF